MVQTLNPCSAVYHLSTTRTNANGDALVTGEVRHSTNRFSQFFGTFIKTNSHIFKTSSVCLAPKKSGLWNNLL